jgi:hypothetical protein
LWQQQGGASALTKGEATSATETQRRKAVPKEISFGGLGVGQGSFADHLTRGVEHADLMRAITEIKAEGETADGSSGRSRHERRSDSIRSTPQIITQKQPSSTLPAFNPPSVQKFSHSLASLAGRPASELPIEIKPESFVCWTLNGKEIFSVRYPFSLLTVRA